MIAPRNTHESVMEAIDALATKTCPTCKGNGMVRGYPDANSEIVACPECRLLGRVVPAEDRDEYERLVALDKLMVRE